MPENAPGQPVARMTIEFDGQNFRSKIDGEMPVQGLAFVLQMQLFGLYADHYAAMKQAQMREQLMVARNSLVTHDGKPIH